LVPEWLQDVAEQKTEPDAIQEPPEWLPPVPDPTSESDEVTPTLSEEWLPESDVDDAPPPSSKPVITPKPEITPKPVLPEDSEALEVARQAIRANNLEEALHIYTSLIKRGKMIEKVIEELQETLRKYPVDVALWQALGDAYMRNDSLQEALDSYSKAEDLLR
jgi:tetratricopeptide (TPR) repeat protein